METETDSVQNTMTRLRMKMVQQKIQNEKERLVNRPSSEESSNNDLENQARLQQAMLRRQELLDKIRREQLLNEEAKRPRTYSARRRYTPSPLPIPPSRRSLPEFARYNNYYNQNNPDTYRSQKQDMSQVKHVIEHKIATPNPYHLPPIQNRAVALPQQQPGVIIHPAPQPQIMQAPPPQVIQAPPQHIIQQVPQPVVQNLAGNYDSNKGMFNKAEFGDMMMMQNAQLHQMVMQKMMLRGGGFDDAGCGSRCSTRHSHHHGHVHGHNVYHDAPRASPAVHHHHYSNPPPSQPAIHHYTTMPAMDMRGGYSPFRGFSSGHTGPGYTYSLYDDGTNYYQYH